MRYIIAVIIILLCVSCIPTTKQFASDPKEERIIVEDVVYTPATHGTGSGSGITMNGDITFTSVNVYTSAKYAVVFRCIHGKFIVEDSTIWAHSRERDTGICIYREMYECKYNQDNPIENPRLVDYQLLSIVFGQDTIVHRKVETNKW